jgi:hypothetical protein
MSAQTVLEELTRDELTREHVQQRVDDWSQRIEDLYSRVERQLPSGWAAKRGATVNMREDLMKRLGVPQRDLPTLELLQDGIVRVRFRPYGLWIIGTNGRIDLVKGQERFFLLDHARTFEAADWHVAPATSRSDSKPFNASWLQGLLAA